MVSGSYGVRITSNINRARAIRILKLDTCTLNIKQDELGLSNTGWATNLSNWWIESGIGESLEVGVNICAVSRGTTL